MVSSRKLLSLDNVAMRYLLLNVFLVGFGTTANTSVSMRSSSIIKSVE